MKKRTIFGFRLIAAGLLFLGVGIVAAPKPATANDAACNAWKDLKPYISSNFFKVTGEHRDNLLRNVNQAAPPTDFKPDMVGYDWAPGGNALLVFVRGGCVTMSFKTTLLNIWAMMKSYPAKMVNFDKSTIEAN